MVESTGYGIAPLDRVDRRILDELQRDGRLSIAELARRVHLSPTPCLERVKRLERDGFVRDYVARLDPVRLGFTLLAFVEVALDRTTPDLFERFRAMVLDLEEVEECHLVAGRFDYLLRVRTTSMDKFREFLAERLAAVPGLQHTHTYFSLEEVKHRGSLPVKEPPPSLQRTRRRRTISPKPASR